VIRSDLQVDSLATETAFGEKQRRPRGVQQGRDCGWNLLPESDRSVARVATYLFVDIDRASDLRQLLLQDLELDASTDRLHGNAQSLRHQLTRLIEIGQLLQQLRL
jgi:hypothetical protein